jgi:F-type H+-transporting ATPase subunit epsilon
LAADESDIMQLELVTPAGPVFQGDVEMVVLPTVTGEMGVLPHHASLVTMLDIGRLRALTAAGDWLNFAVSEGFVKVQFNKVIVLADTAEQASKIDIPRVQRALDRATKRLEMHRQGTVPEGEDIDPYRETLALRRAKNRIRIAQMA